MLRNMHFYRKTPQDLTHGTSSGGAVSIVALLVMAFLFVSQVCVCERDAVELTPAPRR